MLNLNSNAPAFNLDSSTGNKISLEGMAGKFAVIVFYPKNNTPG